MHVAQPDIVEVFDPFPDQGRADSRLADKDDAVVSPANHVQTLVDERLGRIRRQLDLKLGVKDPHLVILVHDQVGQLVDHAVAIFVGAAKIERMADVIVHGAGLHHEITEKFADLVLVEALFPDIFKVIRIKHPVQVAKRTDLQDIDVLREQEKDPDDLQNVIGVLRRTVAQRLQAPGSHLAARCAFVFRDGDQAIQEGEDSGVFDLDRIEVVFLIRCHTAIFDVHLAILFRTAQQARKPEREDCVVVRHTVAIVDVGLQAADLVVDVLFPVGFREHLLHQLSFPAAAKDLLNRFFTVFLDPDKPVMRTDIRAGMVKHVLKGNRLGQRARHVLAVFIEAVQTGDNLVM